MSAAPFNPNIDPAVLGRFEVLEKALIKRLGTTSYRVLQAMWQWRDFRGICRATINTLGNTEGFVKVSPRVVRDSLRRLRRLGFVEDLQHRRRKVATGSGGEMWIYCRKVVGGRAAHPTHDVVVRMPETPYRKLETVAGRGGRREKASKHVVETQKQPNIAVVEQSTSPVGVEAPKEGIRTHPVEQNTSLKFSDDFKTRRSDYIHLHRANNVGEIGFSPKDAYLLGDTARHEEGIKTRRPLVVSYVIEETESNVSHGRLASLVDHDSAQSALAGSTCSNPAVLPTIPVGVVDIDSSVGLGFKPSVRRPLPPPPGHGGVPSYPGPYLMPTARVPAPPKLPEGLSQMEEAVWLGKAYRGAAEVRLKKKCWILVRRDQLARSKLRFVLFAGAKALREAEIPPVAWTLFSVDVWLKYEPQKGKPKPPPLSWVFSPKRIEERAGWFWAESGSYIATRNILGPAARELLQRYDTMRLALFQAGATTPEAVAEVVARFLPGDTYDRLLREAKAQAQDDQVRMNAAAAKGDFLWT